MIITSNESVNITLWNNLLVKSSFASPFQTPEFYNFINSVEDLSADVFAVEVDGEYKALVLVTIQQERGIKVYFSRRGIVYGGPLILSNNKNSLSYLLKSITEYYCTKLIYLEIRNNSDYTTFMKTFLKSGWNYEKHLNVQLLVDNTSVENVLSGMKYNRKREINISYREGAIVRLVQNEKEVIALYQILEALYQRKVKLPLPQIDYFQKLSRSDIGIVFVVLHRDKIIGGSFCVYSENLSINTVYYAGLRNYHKKIFPTHLAIMGAIEYAIDNNLKMVDFMGAGKPEIEYGVRDFKLQFGGDLVEQGRFVKINNPLLYRIGKLGLKLLAKIK